MRTIWKFALEVTVEQDVTAPFGMKPLSIQMQDGKPCLWALVDMSNEAVGHSVYIIPTGHHVDLPSDVANHFVGTFQDGAFVGHVFCKGMS